MDIDNLFSETNVVSTSDVARFTDMPEAQARSWAEELAVAKVGNAFAWVREDVQALADQLDADAPEDDEEVDTCDQNDNDEEDEQEEDDEGDDE